MYERDENISYDAWDDPARFNEFSYDSLAEGVGDGYSCPATCCGQCAVCRFQATGQKQNGESARHVMGRPHVADEKPLTAPVLSEEAERDLEALRVTLLPWEGPAILLVDLDAFFASVEQLDHPAWRGKPVIVGGSPDKRGVVSTASYEARAFGVHSAMPSSQAHRLCPQAFWTRGHFNRYHQISQIIMDIIRSETPHVQQVSIDEAFADVTPTSVNVEHPVMVAARIQARVDTLGVTCSVGVATSKSVAKIASDMDKPHGLTVVYPGGERAFLDPLPVRKLSGIGPAAEKVLHSRGIETLGQLARTEDVLVDRLLGKNGRTMKNRACGLGDVEIVTDEPVKSVSSETSFAVDLTVRADIEAAIDTMAAKVGRRLRKKGLLGKTLGLKMRFDDRTVRSVQRKLPNASDDDLAWLPKLHAMMDDIWCQGIPVRLVGVSMTGFPHQEVVQDSLFAEEELTLFDSEPAAEAQHIPNEEKRRGLLDATDALRDRFGEGAVSFGRELRSRMNTTGTAPKSPEDYK